jgi:trk system potassium uptake protein TrkH
MTALLSTLRGKRHNRLDVHSRLVLLVTAILLASGTAFLLAIEWDGAFAGMNLASRTANALMGSVSPRTAGFNTVPMMSFHPATRWVFIILMFIGASPGGTGGGVKTTTIGLLAVAGVSLVRKRPQPEMWHRMIPLHDLQRASFLIFAALIVCAVSSTGLLLTEMPGGGEHSTDEYLFETFSAFGTVGLSTGVTGDLTVAGRWIIILTMFAGRVGPSVLAALTIKPRALAYRFPEGRVGIG